MAKQIVEFALSVRDTVKIRANGREATIKAVYLDETEVPHYLAEYSTSDGEIKNDYFFETEFSLVDP